MPSLEMMPRGFSSRGDLSSSYAGSGVQAPVRRSMSPAPSSAVSSQAAVPSMLANQFDEPGGFVRRMSPQLRPELIKECRMGPSQAVTVHRSHGRNAEGRHSGVGSASRHAVQTAWRRVKSVASCRRLETSPKKVWRKVGPL